MKTINKLTVFLIMAVALVGAFASCKKDDLSNGGKPRINYVRVTTPTSADSLLVGAGQGQLIAIIGENLGGAKSMWFNNQPASLNPTYITNTSILVAVPTPIPTEINNKLKIYFENGDSLLYDFEVQIAKPRLNNMLSEYVNTGDVATIRGDFFYAPLTVTFTGGAVGELVSVEDKTLRVRVPAGAQPGSITVKTNFGETKSDFWFRDNRNIFLSSDPYTGWWNSSYVIAPASVGPSDPATISGNYIRFKKPIGAWSWNELAGGPASAMGAISKSVPDAAILKPEDYNLKFEVNTIKPYSANMLKINVGLQAEDNDAYQWKPPYDTKGQWQTVVIPFEEIVASYKVKPTVNPNGYWTRLLFHGPGDLDADISLDNFRVVPKVSK
ncbi:MAG: glycan-binding surface protein [Ferruginibacter sp.]|nr:glycan-binding surface protein [Ferruginibacter sp.]